VSFELAASAQQALEQILVQRAEDAGVLAATNLHGRFQSVFELIGALGAPGEQRLQLLPPDYRFVPKDRFVIVWRGAGPERPDHRVIVAIVDARRDLTEALQWLQR